MALLAITFTGVFRGLIGVAFLVGIGWLISTKRKAIRWPLILKGIAAQIILAILILKVPYIDDGFEFLSRCFVKVISFTQAGTKFLFATFSSNQTVIENPLVNFAIIILPTIMFFSALSSLLYYWGILQRVVYGFAWMMKRIMRLSGAESLSAAGNIFMGQTESPLLVKPYLDGMTKSEIMCLMTGGMATIAGGVLAGYIEFLGGGDPQERIYFAKHLMTASVMSAPAAIVAAKLLVPETEEYNKDMRISKESIGSNALEALTNGTSQGLKLAVNVGAMLLVFTALVALCNYAFGKLGMVGGINDWIAHNTNFDRLSFEFIIGYTFSPIAWLLGVCKEDMVLVGQLLGEKTMLNEFFAYTTLGEMKAHGVFAEKKSILMATYILCGFANFASIGIQIGGIGSLSPKQKPTLSKYGFYALIGGTMACLFTAAIVGILG